MTTSFLRLIWPIFFLTFSVPLASFAAVTTIIALIALALWVTVVYLEMAITLSHNWFRNNSFKEHILQHRPFDILMTGFQSPPYLHGQRNTFLLSNSSQDNSPVLRWPKKSESLASLTNSPGPDRDFEGVGGWRISDNTDNEAEWMKINSRLELPVHTCDRRRHHQRSLTNGSQRSSWSQEAIRVSPFHDRVRVPTAMDFAYEQDSYFASQ